MPEKYANKMAVEVKEKILFLDRTDLCLYVARFFNRFNFGGKYREKLTVSKFQIQELCTFLEVSTQTKEIGAWN